MTAECPTDAELARLLLKPPGSPEWKAFEAHAAGCAVCRSRLAASAAQETQAYPAAPKKVEGTLLSDDQPTLLSPHRVGTRILPHTDNPSGASSPTANPDNLPTAFGRYRVIRPLGAGGFGTVYLCEDAELTRQVAVKVCRGGCTTGSTDAERFLEEARRLAKLSHPGIVAVYDVGVHERNVYVVSAFLEGADLALWLKQNRPTWKESVRIVASIADALAHAHSRLIVHRDVKPSNIIINPAHEPILVDFGLALDEAQSGGSELGIFSGTPAYMSPEQAAGFAHRIDGRTDIYALGVVLYEMLTGHLPFRSRSQPELLRQVREDEPQPLRQLEREIPPDLERACLRALAKQQQDRYTTAADFAEALREILETSAGMPATPQTRREILPLGAETPSRRSTRAAGRAPGSTRRRTRDAERRQVTLLVCGSDVFESDAYLENLDADQQAEVLGAFVEACERAVTRFEGSLVHCNEQGLLACFGYPVAFENAARRAARTALGILENMASLGDRLRRQHGLELHAWAGIHTGPVVVESGEASISLVGEARTVALRLADVSVPGEIICTGATQQLIENRFQCVSFGTKKLKGVAKPVEIFGIEGVSNIGSLLEAASPAQLTPLTGRKHELSLLKGRWEQTRAGASEVILLTGEPGLGKSRLVHALKDHLDEVTPASDRTPASERHEPALSIIEWRCSPHYQNTGLYPASGFFERFLGFGSEENPAARLEKLIQHLSQYGLAKPSVVPLFATLLGLPTAERFPALGLSPVREREETFRALEDWLAAIANRRPVLFICEDLHWADPSTLEFLGGLIEEGLSGPVLILLTARPEFRAPWATVAHQTSLALNRLSRDQAREMMEKKAGHELAETVIDQVFERTSGVPLFIEEFTKVLPPDQAADASLSREIPATLQDLIMARVDRVEGDREVAQLAAVLGREFNHELLAAVANLEAPALNAEMRQLVQAEIIYQRGRPPLCVYTFKHALLQDALYNSLVKTKRQELHRRVGDVLEEQFGLVLAETRPELLAYHFSEGWVPEKAIKYWLRAGLQSRERSAELEAIGHLTRGAALIEAIAESPERDALELQLLGPLGTAYIAARGYAAPEVGPVFQRARKLCERVGQPPQLLAMMLGIWEWHTVRADLRLCVDLAQEGMAFATVQNDPGMLMEAAFMDGETMLYRGQFADAFECMENAVSNYDDRERTRYWSNYTGHDAGITHRSNLAVLMWHLGYPDQALKINREMRQLAREIGHPFSLAYALHHTAWLYQSCRMGAEIQSVAEEEIAIATAQGFALWQATGTFSKGAGMFLQGDHEQGITFLLRGLRDFRASGAELSLPGQLGFVAEACTKVERYRDAHRALDEAFELVEKNDERCHEAELYRIKGELLLAESPDPDPAAEGLFRQAIAIAKKQQSKAWTLRATMSLARLWQRLDRHAAAREAVAEVLDTFTEGFATPDLVEARALLDTRA